MDGTIRDRLYEMSNEKYRNFSAKLLPGTDSSKILGVALPELRKIARELAADGSWKEYLADNSFEYFEESMLQGLIIGYIKVSFEERVSYIEDFLPQIDNWSVCDSFCATLKFAEDDPEKTWAFIQPCFFSEKEYEVRFAAVMSLLYFIKENGIDRVLASLGAVRHEGYYAKMAVAWAISECYIHFPEKTLVFLKKNELDFFTYNKALQKITESNRASQEEKTLIRSMKRK